MKTLYLKGVIGIDILAEKIKEEININSTEKLRVFVNSVGGSVFEAYDIYDLFTLYKGDIEFVIMPYAASAMGYVIMAGKTIAGFKNSLWMGHRIQTIIGGDADMLLREAKIMQGLENIIIEAYQKRLKGTKEEILNKLRNQLWGIGWEQLTEMGIIDNVIDSTEEMEIPDEIKSDIEIALQEATKVNIEQIITMRMEKIEKQLKNENKDYSDIYERIAAQLDIDEYINNTDRFENPYPNEHAARVREPGDFEQNSFRRKNIESGIDIIIGKLKGKTTTTTQAYRFKKDKFTVSQAKKWLKDNNIKYIRFEPASDESNADESANDKILIMEENSMDLQEFLNSNPDAKAEYDNLLSAKDQEIEKARSNSDVGKERERIFNILKFSGYIPTDEASKAINEGADSGQFAQDELMRQNQKRKDEKNKVDFGNLKDSTLPGDQDTEGKKEAEANAGDKKAQMEAFDKKLDEASAKKSGKEVN